MLQSLLWLTACIFLIIAFISFIKIDNPYSTIPFVFLLISELCDLLYGLTVDKDIYVNLGFVIIDIVFIVVILKVRKNND